VTSLAVVHVERLGVCGLGSRARLERRAVSARASQAEPPLMTRNDRARSGARIGDTPFREDVFSGDRWILLPVMEPPYRTSLGPPAQRGKGRATAKCRRLRKGSGHTVRFRCCLRDFRQLSRSRRQARTLLEGASPGFAARTTQVADLEHITLPRPSAHGAGPGLATSGSPRARTMEGSSNQKTLLTPTQWGKLLQIHID